MFLTNFVGQIRSRWIQDGPLLWQTSPSDCMASVANLIHSNDLEACCKSCVWFHHGIKFSTRFKSFGILIHFKAVSTFSCGEWLFDFLHICKGNKSDICCFIGMSAKRLVPVCVLQDTSDGGSDADLPNDIPCVYLCVSITFIFIREQVSRFLILN